MPEHLFHRGFDLGPSAAHGQLGIGVSAGLRKEDVKLRDALNKAFADMIADGTYKKINEKYFPFPLN